MYYSTDIIIIYQFPRLLSMLANGEQYNKNIKENILLMSRCSQMRDTLGLIVVLYYYA